MEFFWLENLLVFCALAQDGVSQTFKRLVNLFFWNYEVLFWDDMLPVLTLELKNFPLCPSLFLNLESYYFDFIDILIYALTIILFSKIASILLFI